LENLDDDHDDHDDHDDDDDDDDDIRLGKVLNMKSSVTESLGCYVLKQHRPWFD
jgi:hypothetical protein